jgi:hypothetical protein
MEALVNGDAVPGIGRVLDYARLGGYAVAARQALPAIVHDDHFKIPPGLPAEGFQALPESRIRR